MKKAHLLTIVCASALLPLSAATAQSCANGHGSHGYSRSYTPSHSYGYSSSRSYGGSDSSRSSHSYRSSYRSHRSSCGSDRIRLIGGSQRGKGTRPRGWHDKHWFTKRGYNLANYSHVHERSGVVHHGSNRSSHNAHSSRSSHSGHRH